MVAKSRAKTGADDDGPWQPAPVPATSDLSEVEEAAKICTACHLYKRGAQAVFGEGPRRAKLLMLGEQPGDQEDLAGKPFVGPAGKLLDRALAEAGIERTRFTSQIRSSTSSGSRGVSGVSIKNRTPVRLRGAGRGWKRSCG